MNENADYVKVPIFPDCVDNFPDFSPYFPILCILLTFTWSVSAPVTFLLHKKSQKRLPVYLDRFLFSRISHKAFW